MQGEQGSLEDVPIVQISPEGRFKYIFIQARVYEKDEEKTHTFVRGDRSLHYHIDIFTSFINDIQAKGFQVKNKRLNSGKFAATRGETEIFFECLGGGRIEHNYIGNKCFIYGYSNRYGAIDHSITQRLVSSALQYPIHEITTSQEGY